MPNRTTSMVIGLLVIILIVILVFQVLDAGHEARIQDLNRQPSTEEINRQMGGSGTPPARTP